MENQGKNLVEKLIADRKSRINLLQIDSLCQEFQELIWESEFLFQPLRKVDTEAIKDNEETDQLMKEWAWENIDLPYCIDNEIAF